MRIPLATFSLLALLTLAPSSHADQGAVLLVWTPHGPSEGTPIVYHVYGADGADEVYLGSTSWTAYEAPAGYASYRVKYVDGNGEHSVNYCVHADPQNLSVGIQPC